MTDETNNSVGATPLLPQIEITGVGSVTTIKINGQEIPGVTAFRLEQHCGGFAELHLAIFGEFAVNVPGIVPLPEPWKSVIAYDEETINEDALTKAVRRQTHDGKVAATINGYHRFPFDRDTDKNDPPVVPKHAENSDHAEDSPKP